MKAILIVDDNYGVRSTLSRFLQAKQYRTEDASSGAVAIKKAVTNEYDVVLLDQVMPEMTGTDVLIELKKITPQSKVIMMTGFGTIQDAIDAIKKGASEYIQKPIDFDELNTMIKRCLEEKRFNQSLNKSDIDFTLSTLSNPLRRKILKLIKLHDAIHLMKIAKELCIDDHTKIVFHLKNLISTGLINKDEKKGYHLTKEGHKAYACLNIIEKQLS
jgi:DNA-binding NtrC family response regulator